MSHAHHTHMDTVAGVYDATIPPHVRDHYLRKRTAFVRRYGGGRVIADIGCGTGVLGAALRHAGFEVIGIDESVGMLHACREQRRIVCACGESAALPIATGAVDGALCVASLHHIREPDQVRETIREMVRIVKPGGWIVLWDHNPLNPYWGPLMQRLPQDQEPTRLVPLSELRAGVDAAGAVTVRAVRLGLVPEFAPAGLLWLFQALEWVVERVPGLRCLCAHNVLLARKPLEQA